MVTKYERNFSKTRIASHSTGSRCRDGERSGENEVFSGREGEPSSPGASPIPPSSSSSKEPLKVMPAPPPKENAWAKRSAATTGSSDGEGRPPVSPVSPSSSTPPKSGWEHCTRLVLVPKKKQCMTLETPKQANFCFNLFCYIQEIECVHHVIDAIPSLSLRTHIFGHWCRFNMLEKLLVILVSCAKGVRNPLYKPSRRNDQTKWMFCDQYWNEFSRCFPSESSSSCCSYGSADERGSGKGRSFCICKSRVDKKMEQEFVDQKYFVIQILFTHPQKKLSWHFFSIHYIISLVRSQIPPH